jgi:hypothetical protein
MRSTPKKRSIAVDLFICSRTSSGPIRAGHIGLSIYPIARMQVSRCVSAADRTLPEPNELGFGEKSRWNRAPSHRLGRMLKSHRISILPCWRFRNLNRFFENAIKRPISDGRAVTPNIFSAHGSARRIPIRFGGIEPQPTRASEMPVGRRRKSNELRCAFPQHGAEVFADVALEFGRSSATCDGVTNWRSNATSFRS